MTKNYEGMRLVASMPITMRSLRFPLFVTSALAVTMFAQHKQYLHPSSQ
jgi:hypothetical protein